MPRREFDALRADVERLQAELEALRGGGAAGATQATRPADTAEAAPEGGDDFPIEEG